MHCVKGVALHVEQCTTNSPTALCILPSCWYIRRTARNSSTERKATGETATAKPDGTKQTCADRQWQDNHYYPEPEQIYAEMDDF